MLPSSLASSIIKIRWSLFILLILFDCGLTGCTGNNTPQEKSEKTDSLAVTIDSLVNHAMSENDITGMAIGITINGKRSYYNYGVGIKNTDHRITNTTLFEIGSVSKTFTASLATYAELGGYLSLNDTVTKYLPYLHGSGFDKIQLRDLGTHTAGGLPLQLPDGIEDSLQLMNYYKTWRPDYAAGTYRVYSNPSIGLLGIIVANSMHQPFAELMEKNLFPGLVMNNSFINVPADRMNNYAQGYNKTDSAVHVNPAILAQEAYGVKSCTKDLLQFVDVNMGVAKVIDQWQQAVINTHTAYFKSGPLTQDLIWEQYNYSVDSNTLIEGNSVIMSQQPNPVIRINPPSPPAENVLINKTGSTNGFGAYILFVPSKKIGVVILANKAYPNAVRVRLGLKLLSIAEKSLGK